MSSRTRHPAVSFALFVLICGLGYLAYVNRDMFRGSPAEELLSQDQKELIQERILEELDEEMCFHGLRGQLSWRPNEQRYLQDIELEDGEVCERKAREICEHVAQIIYEQAGVVSTVIAYDRAGRELGRKVL
jgi:hypothetical protein